MKCVIIGHTSGLGQAFYKNFQSQSLDTRAAQNDVDTYPNLTNPQDVRTPPNQPGVNATANNTTQQNQSPVSRFSQHLAETSLPQLAGEAAGGLAAVELGRRALANIVPTPGERVQKQQNELRQQELELQRQKVANGTTLSPYEQARADTEKLRGQQIQQQIELEAKQFELSKMKAEQAQAAAQQRLAAQTQIKDPVEQRLAEISKSQGYGGNIAPAGNTVPQVNTMQPQPAPPPEVRPAPVAPTPITPAPVATAPTQTEPMPQETPKAAIPPTKAPKQKIPMPEGWGKGMSWLTSGYGVEGAQAFIDQYNNGKPFKSHDEMNKVYQEVMTKPKYSDIPKPILKERGILKRSELPILPMNPVPPPRTGGGAVQGGGGMGGGAGLGGGLIRNLTDPLQLKQ
jgi:hypothetical protein